MEITLKPKEHNNKGKKS